MTLFAVVNDFPLIYAVLCYWSTILCPQISPNSKSTQSMLAEVSQLKKTIFIFLPYMQKKVLSLLNIGNKIIFLQSCTVKYWVALSILLFVKKGKR